MRSIDMLCIADFSGYFRKLNPAWERVLGFTREEQAYMAKYAHSRFTHGICPKCYKKVVDAEA